MIRLLRTTSQNQDFIELVALLDKDLEIRDGDEHSFYAQFNAIDTLSHAVVAYDNDTPVGCGAIKKHNTASAEIKRMFVSQQAREKKIATTILAELENWSRELSYERCILETGKKQPEAIGLYTKSGYVIMKNYGQYADVENSICFEKKLTQTIF